MSWTVVEDGNTLQVRARLHSTAEFDALIMRLMEKRPYLEEAEKPKGEKS